VSPAANSPTSPSIFPAAFSVFHDLRSCFSSKGVVEPHYASPIIPTGLWHFVNARTWIFDSLLQQPVLLSAGAGQGKGIHGLIPPRRPGRCRQAPDALPYRSWSSANLCLYLGQPRLPPTSLPHLPSPFFPPPPLPTSVFPAPSLGAADHRPGIELTLRHSGRHLPLSEVLQQRLPTAHLLPPSVTHEPTCHFIHGACAKKKAFTTTRTPSTDNHSFLVFGDGISRPAVPKRATDLRFFYILTAGLVADEPVKSKRFAYVRVETPGPSRVTRRDYRDSKAVTLLVWKPLTQRDRADRRR